MTEDLIIPKHLEAAFRFLQTAGYLGLGLHKCMRALIAGRTPLELVGCGLLEPEDEAPLNAVVPMSQRNAPRMRPHAPAFF